ncbi:MAG: right-handed parallel beta-helix repeat-containing protein, partial [Verrucomicrobia bacterium]|nr:right-handed parallel beta-helix repeat-containing protein [Verrucomicrobiota bacterium]
LDSYGGAPTTAWFYFGTTDGGTTPANWSSNAIAGLIDNGPFSLPVNALQQTTTYFFRAFSSNLYGTAWASNSAAFSTGPPLIGFALAASSGPESTSLVAISLSITSPIAYAHPITVTFTATGGTATAGSDYVLDSNMVTLNAGQTSTNIYLHVTHDELPEADETVLIQLTQFVNARAGAQVTHTYTILNDDAAPDVAFQAPAYTFSESNGFAIIAITLSTNSGLDVSLDYTTLDGAAKKNIDYLTRAGSLLWPAGTRDTKMISVPLINNDESTGNRFFQMSLSGILNATALNGTLVDVTIEEDDISLPEVTNAQGATGIRSRIAVLNGEVIRGVPPPSVTLYWGPTDGATNAAAWLFAQALGVQNGVFSREISGLTSNTLYYYRTFVQNTSGVAWAASTTNFTSTGAKDYYVNDGSLANDVFCSAVGNDANSGAQADKPKANLKTLLDVTDIEPGDTIWVDTGNYSIPATIVFTSADVGAPGATVLVRGSHHSAGANFTASGANGIEIDVAGDAFMRIEKLNISGAEHGVYMHGSSIVKCRNTEIVGCNISDNLSTEGGIYIISCSEVTIAQCTANNNGLSGIYLDTCTDVTIVSNTCSKNWAWGIIGQSTFNPVVKYNKCFNQNVLEQAYGISFTSGNNEVLIGNACYSNTTDGIFMTGQFSKLDGNVCYANGRDGINLTGAGLLLTGNTLYSNGRYGISAPADTGLQADHNLLHNNGNYHLYLHSAGVRAHLEYNTLYAGKGLYINTPFAVTNRNNIIWATGAGNFAVEVPTLPTGGGFMLSDYNDFYATASANAGKWGAQVCGNIDDWQFFSWNDPNSLGADPRFVSTTAPQDFHLKSRNASWHGGLWQTDLETSPCIDAGDPGATFKRESTYNGLRVNLGAYGNTEQASRTDYDGPLYTLTVSVSPAIAGRLTVQPESSIFPTNVVVTLSTVLTNSNYRWNSWSGDISSTNQVFSFTLTNDVFAQALYAVLTSNTNGVPDSWLIGHGLPTGQAGTDADDDHDGHTNGQEYYAGTDPTNAQSVLKFMFVAPSSSARIALSVQSIVGKSYIARSTPNTLPLVWAQEAAATTSLGALSTAPIAGNGGTLVIYVAATSQARIYRVETLP